jgi:hypothetical protein
MAWFRSAAVVLATGLAVLAVRPAAALDGATRQFAQAVQADVTGDEPARPVRRARTQIEVTPPRPMHRECSFRLVQEFRPSGTVVVPRERCWWAR